MESDGRFILDRPASSERTSPDVLSQQIKKMSSQSLLADFLNAVPDILVVLNNEREIIHANKSLLTLLGLNENDMLRGLRLGEALQCVESTKSTGGCGTADACRTCGALRSMLLCQEGTANTQECRILRTNGDAFDLQITTNPIKLGGENFVILAANDISSEKRRRALERIFFHDIMNTAGGLRGMSEMMSNATLDDISLYQTAIQEMSEELIQQINAQRQLTAAENNELNVNFLTIDAYDVLFQVSRLYQNHIVSEGRILQIDPNAQNFTFVSDQVLLQRALGNMTKNALEASLPGETVTIGSHKNGESVIFWVHNPAVIPHDVQLQIFKRSFTTKGVGRGLGTYSIKLLTERYLHGKASFTSKENKGTTFEVELPLEPTPIPIE